MSYRFYDPIIQLAQNQTSRTVKDYFALIQSLHIQRIEDEKSLGQLILDKFSLGKNIRDKIPKPPVFRYPVIEHENQIDHSQSVHCLGL